MFLDGPRDIMASFSMLRYDLMISTRASFINELSEVDQKLLRMGGMVRGMIVDAVDSFVNGELALVETVFSNDDYVDSIDDDIESTGLRLLALQQPMARDLRRVSSALKVSSELERIGDHAVEIARYARKIHRECFPPRPLIDLAAMATATEKMLDDSLSAFVHGDIELIDRICRDDDVVDAEYKSLREQLIQIGTRDSAMVAAASYTLIAIGSIERVADHATNIAERVAYIETGSLRRLARRRKPEPEESAS